MEDSSELEQLWELIEHFPDKYSVDSVAEANRVVRSRYEVLDDQIIPVLAGSIKKGEVELDSETCFKLCREIHEIMFSDVISINGQFRKKEHRDGGAVYFGGQKPHEMTSKFKGSPPENIEEHLSHAFEHLSPANENPPIDNALRFYQKFVLTHPFYDGNGRIARLMVNLYLYNFGKFIDWKNLQGTGKFLKKLNTYHKSRIETHFYWWAKVCYKYVYDFSEEDEES